MATDTSATTREETPHAPDTSQTNTIVDALKRRAQAVLTDTSIDVGSRAIIRYALEINDPYLAELVRRVDEGEHISETFDFSQPPKSDDEASDEENVNALTELICGCGGESAAALLVLMGTLENSAHPRLLANAAKHSAFTWCGDRNFYRMVEAQIAEVENEVRER